MTLQLVLGGNLPVALLPVLFAALTRFGGQIT